MDQVAVVAIDPETLNKRGGAHAIRTDTQSWRSWFSMTWRQAKPRVVAISDVGNWLVDHCAGSERRMCPLAASLLATKKLILACADCRCGSRE